MTRRKEVELCGAIGNKLSITIALFMLLLLVQFQSAISVGQSPGDDTPTLRSIMSEKMPDRPDVQARLDALIKSTQQAREVRQSAEIPSPAETSLQQPSTAFSMGIGSLQGPKVDDADNEAASSGNATRSMSEIRERIRILQRLRRDRQMSDAFKQANPIQGGVAAPVLASPGGVVNEPSQSANGPEANQSSTATTAIDESLQAPDEQHTPEPLEDKGTSVSSQRILSKPVNTLALGESLYQTGNYEAALKAFRQVEVSKLSQSDRTWLDLLVALCQRRTGDFSTAEGTLREIANEESSDYPVKAAQWWLKHASASNETRTKMIELSSEFGSLLERASSHVNR
ncbi:MAG: hypothetical protein KDB00_11680 [Planctomycetales bacterium]|nr:hypothetical protein [Planctomycetales bacterium]